MHDLMTIFYHKGSTVCSRLGLDLNFFQICIANN